MGAVIGIIIYAIIAYITCPRKENGSFEEGAIALYIIVPGYLPTESNWMN